MPESQAGKRNTTGLAALAVLGPTALTAFAVAVAAPITAFAAGEPASNITSYDAGYASEAASSCPSVTLVAELTAETKADPDFKRGQEMFKHYVETIQVEGACKAALKLYDAETGKVAKVLRRK